MDYIAYYEKLADLQGDNPLAHARTKDTETSVPSIARPLLFNIAGEIKNKFNEFGSPMPPLMEGCTVLVLCCGTGRDVYLAAQLVGEDGKVIGLEPVDSKLEVAERYLKKEIKQFGYSKCNVEFLKAAPENMEEIADDSMDIVISNCTFNMSPDKEAYIKEVQRVLKDNGEFYFTDIFTDRRIPEELSSDPAKVAIELGGAMYINDFRRLVQANGFKDPRYLFTNKTPMSEDEQAMFPDIAFATITSRLINSQWTEDVCESYGETITYKGTLPGYPDYFLFDKDIKFPTGKTCTICGNVSGTVAKTRYSKAFDFTFDRSKHLGDTHGDHIIKTAPDWDGEIDEDDQPQKVSCC
ncbi:MAG: methyltransferase domain-containing protein [Coriobacteriales bacterium]|jgi:arsenite methyltransferase